MKKKQIINRNEVIGEKTKDASCLCASLEIRFEDYTLRKYGQELTRKIETRVCQNCGDKHLHGQSVLDMETEIKAKVLSLAAERFEFPNDPLYLRYCGEPDLMSIKFSNNKCVKTESDYTKGLIYNFDYKGEITSVEVLDFYGKYAEESE